MIRRADEPDVAPNSLFRDGEAAGRGSWIGYLRCGDPVRVVLLIATPVAWGTGTRGDGAALAIGAVAAVGVRLLRATAKADLAACLLVLSAQIGAIAGLTSSTTWWDVASHAATAMTVSLILTTGKRRLRPGAALGTTLLLGLLWELLEFTADAFLRTDLSAGSADTLGDVGMDVLGASLAWLISSSQRPARAAVDRSASSRTNQHPANRGDAG